MSFDQPLCAGYGIGIMVMSAGVWFRTALVTPAERTAVLDGNGVWDKMEELLGFYTFPQTHHESMRLVTCDMVILSGTPLYFLQRRGELARAERLQARQFELTREFLASEEPNLLTLALLSTSYSYISDLVSLRFHTAQGQRVLEQAMAEAAKFIALPEGECIDITNANALRALFAQCAASWCVHGHGVRGMRGATPTTGGQSRLVS